MRDAPVDSIRHHAEDDPQSGPIRDARAAPTQRARAQVAPQPGPFAWVSRNLGEPAVDLEDKEALASLLER
jgi:hypothetical protein